MRKIDNFDNVTEQQGGDFERLPTGGHICKITLVEDVPEKEYLKFEFDIAEGKYQGWFAETYQRAGFWGGKFIRSYKKKAAGFFKGFVTAVEESNPKYKWAWEEQTLNGKMIGLVLGSEEYVSNSGEVKERLYVAQNRSVDAIRKGDYKVPELKKLKADALPRNEVSGFTEADEPLPF